MPIGNADDLVKVDTYYVLDEADAILQKALAEGGLGEREGDLATFIATPATQLLASWSGNIASVAAPAYTGTITKVVIRKGGADLAVPAALSVGDSVELHAFGKLTGGAAVKCAMGAIVTKPDGTVLPYTEHVMITKQEVNQELRFAIMNLTIDQGGTWKAAITYWAVY